ncbi:MAG: MBL fold metallo-hydrolase [Paludibacter sp.]|nr:MBL fold metallo-hydrolase [Paludibacter sp.]MDD4198876.1 MBL fold metallo-hydrolase [Paludibacter sp.]MDD4426774.1 MBL fold metallo-hydrolase [Paludibacter sp.]
MTIKIFTFNPIQENTYVVHDETGKAIVIDAGCCFENEKNALRSYIDDNKLTLVKVLNTHLHLDHQFGNKFLFDTYGIAPEAHGGDEFLLKRIVAGAVIYGFPVTEDAQPIGTYLQENQEINVGNITLKTIHIPGHSPGHLVFHNEKEKVLFAGDVLFNGSIGRTDLEQGDHATLIRNITEKLLILPDETVVYPGHGPATTIGKERVSNPYL